MWRRIHCTCSASRAEVHRAGLLATRWLFDGLFPFFLLFVFSLFTKPGGETSAIDGFTPR